MKLKPVEKKSLSDAVYEQLRDQIVLGVMEPGAALPSERALCEMLDVNRGAVREALKRLEQARLVSIQHGGATRVLDFKETAGTDLLAQLLVSPDGSINTSVARSVMELRSALGVDIVRRCVERAPEVADLLEGTIDEMRNAADLEALRELDMTFWALLVDGSQNVAYQLVFNSIRDIYDQLAEVLAQVVRGELEDIETRVRMVESIREKDTDSAEFYARDLLSRGEATMARLAEKLDFEAG